MKHHEVRCWSHVFDLAKARIKTFEIRINDRDYQMHDRITLVRCADLGEDVQPVAERITFRIGFVLHAGLIGLLPGHCAFSLLDDYDD